MSVHMPAVKICEKLKKMDSQICELKYGIMEFNVPPPAPNVQCIASSLSMGPGF